MHLPLFIAKRYLFSKKKQNAINIISTISLVGVAISTAALIIILSVFNGIDIFFQESAESLTADITISPAEGKFTAFDKSIGEQLEKIAEIEYFLPVVEEQALVRYGERFKPVIVKGVNEKFIMESGFIGNVIYGDASLKLGDIYYGVVGYGVASELEIGLNFSVPLRFYYPNRTVSSANSPSALNSEHLYPGGFFSSQQEFDNQYVITDIDFARNLFRIGEQFSKIEIKLKNQDNLEEVKSRIKEFLPQQYKVLDKFELNKSFYTMMKSEKMAIFFILLFILLIASFNIVGSISMLILDKKEDLNIYKALGMPGKGIVSIFKTEGNMITILGGIIGFLIGISVCFLQEKYGLIKLGDGAYAIEAYPVKIIFKDIVMIMGLVLLIGYTASYFPVRYLVGRLLK